jgi:hypothetical protein
MSYTNLNQDFIGGKISLTPNTRIPSLFTPTAAQEYKLGTVLEEHGGTSRMWRYCKNGAVALSKALMTCTPLHDAQALAQIQTGYGAAVGAMRFDCILTTANALTDDELIDGTLLVNDGGDAMGDSYIIKNNKWKTTDTIMTIEIADEGGVRTAIAVTDDLTFLKHKCHEVIVTPTTQTSAGPAIGVPNVDVTANYYFWAQYRGWCPMILDTTDTIIVNNEVGRAATLDVAGAVGVPANDGTDAVWGVCAYASTNAEAAIINLMLP